MSRKGKRAAAFNRSARLRSRSWRIERGSRFDGGPPVTWYTLDRDAILTGRPDALGGPLAAAPSRAGRKPYFVTKLASGSISRSILADRGVSGRLAARSTAENDKTPGFVILTGRPGFVIFGQRPKFGRVGSHDRELKQ